MPIVAIWIPVIVIMSTPMAIVMDVHQNGYPTEEICQARLDYIQTAVSKSPKYQVLINTDGVFEKCDTLDNWRASAIKDAPTFSNYLNRVEAHPFEPGVAPTDPVRKQSTDRALQRNADEPPKKRSTA